MNSGDIQEIEPFRNLSALGMIVTVNPVERFPDRLSALVEAGYEYLYFADELFSHVRERGGISEIKKAVADSGLKVRSAHFKYLYPGPGDTLEGLKENHLRDLDTAAELGLQCVTTHYLSITGMGEPGFLTAATLAAFSRNWIHGVEAVYEEAFLKLGGKETFLARNNDLYRWLCDEAARRNLAITIETATCHLTKRPAQIIRHIEEIGRPNLGICLDSGHSHIMMGDVPSAVRECGQWLMETHFHDNFGDRDLHRPPGIGTIRWREVILALREIGFPGPVTFEMGAPSHQSHEEEIRLYARNWREFLYATAAQEAWEKAQGEE